GGLGEMNGVDQRPYLMVDAAVAERFVALVDLVVRVLEVVRFLDDVDARPDGLREATALRHVPERGAEDVRIVRQRRRDGGRDEHRTVDPGARVRERRVAPCEPGGEGRTPGTRVAVGVRADQRAAQLRLRS